MRKVNILGAYLKYWEIYALKCSEFDIKSKTERTSDKEPWDLYRRKLSSLFSFWYTNVALTSLYIMYLPQLSGAQALQKCL